MCFHQISQFNRSDPTRFEPFWEAQTKIFPSLQRIFFFNNQFENRSMVKKKKNKSSYDRNKKNNI